MVVLPASLAHNAGPSIERDFIIVSNTITMNENDAMLIQLAATIKIHILKYIIWTQFHANWLSQTTKRKT